jgi:hypothetical protein
MVYSRPVYVTIHGLRSCIGAGKNQQTTSIDWSTMMILSVVNFTRHSTGTGFKVGQKDIERQHQNHLSEYFCICQCKINKAWHVQKQELWTNKHDGNEHELTNICYVKHHNCTSTLSTMLIKDSSSRSFYLLGCIQNKKNYSVVDFMTMIGILFHALT